MKRREERGRLCGWLKVCVRLVRFFSSSRKDFFYFLEQRTGPLHIHTLIRYIRRRTEQAGNSLDKSFFLPPSYAFQSLMLKRNEREREREVSASWLNLWAQILVRSGKSVSLWVVFFFELDTTTCSSFVCLSVCLLDSFLFFPLSVRGR